ncbi:ORF40 [Plodia interpunctella granulovirus]|uniref:ORF40 n=1 Tax=Plodia interpunctella granulovirus TaxID=262175 RepID=A0A1L5JGK4_9BBAC|nr:ORF40 [Plodia interpunctella granulovirus]APO13924.1 ORF40 [Plodia interpunctella granulovirus]
MCILYVFCRDHYSRLAMGDVRQMIIRDARCRVTSRFPNHHRVTSYHRMIIINWMYSFTPCLGVNRVQKAVNYLDKYMECCDLTVDPVMYMLLGGGALLTTTNKPRVRWQIINILIPHYMWEYILTAEFSILNIVRDGYAVSKVPPNQFLRKISTNKQVYQLGQFILLISLLDYSIAQQRSYKLAFIAHSMASNLLGYKDDLEDGFMRADERLNHYLRCHIVNFCKFFIVKLCTGETKFQISEFQKLYRKLPATSKAALYRLCFYNFASIPRCNNKQRIRLTVQPKNDISVHLFNHILSKQYRIM